MASSLDDSMRQLVCYGDRLPPSTISAILPNILQTIVKSNLNSLVESEELIVQLFARKSLDQVAARLDVVIPETYPDENVQRAITLAGGAESEVMKEILKTMIYVASNQLFPEFTKDYHDYMCAIIALCRLSGLANWSTICDLVQLSRSSPVITATIDMLFEASVITVALDLVELLLRADDRIYADRPVRRMPGFPERDNVQYSCANDQKVTPLFLAVIYNSIELANLMLKYGASTSKYANFDNIGRIQPLVYAVLHKPSDDSGAMIRLLLKKGAPVDSPSDHSQRSPLQAAFEMSDVAMIGQLVEAGADLNYVRHQDLRYHILDLKVDDKCHGRANPSYNFKRISCLGLAALFGKRMAPSSQTAPADAAERKSGNEEMALQLCREILDKLDLNHHSSRIMVADAFIAAVSMGYTKVQSFLRGKQPMNCSHINGNLSAITAAVYYGEMETLRLLLDMEPSLNINTRLLRCAIFDSGGRIRKSSLLHVAISRGTLDIARVLIQKGADVNSRCEVSAYSSIIDGEEPLAYGGSRTSCLSPLGFAIHLCRWDETFLLAESGAVATSNDLFAAIKAGHLALVKLLFAATGLHPSEAIIKGNINAYEFAVLSNAGEIASYLHSTGATVPEKVLATVFGVMKSPQQIQAIIPQPLLQNPAEIGLDSAGRSYLENAYLGGNRDVIEFALLLNRKTYDSGAMCAAVRYLALHPSLPDEDSLLHELLRCREQHLYTSIDGALENTAISLAIWCLRWNLVTALLDNDRREALAQHPAIVCESGTGNYLISEQYNPEEELEGRYSIENDNSWHEVPLKASLLLFAVIVYFKSDKGKETIQKPVEATIEKLLDTGYRADGFTLRVALKVALKTKLSFHVLKRLVQSCSDVDANCAENMDMGYNKTPLYLAVSSNNLELARLLIEHGAHVNVVRYGCKCCLAKAAWLGSLPMIRLLLDNGAAINRVSISLGFSDNFESEDDSIGSPLGNATVKGYIGLARYLISHGANVNARVWDTFDHFGGRTALEGAAEYGRLDMVQFLLASGASITNHGSVQYVRAIQLANQEGYHTIAGHLKSQRPWNTEDQAIEDEWKRCTHYRSPSVIVHPKELSLAELVDTVAKLEDDATEQPFDPGPPFLQPCKWKKRVAIMAQRWVNNVSAANISIKDNLLRIAVQIATSSIQLHASRGKFTERRIHLIASRALHQWSLGIQTADGCLDLRAIESILSAAETAQNSLVDRWPWDDGIADSFLMMDPYFFDDDDCSAEADSSDGVLLTESDAYHDDGHPNDAESIDSVLIMEPGMRHDDYCVDNTDSTDNAMTEPDLHHEDNCPNDTDSVPMVDLNIHHDNNCPKDADSPNILISESTRCARMESIFGFLGGLANCSGNAPDDDNNNNIGLQESDFYESMEWEGQSDVFQPAQSTSDPERAPNSSSNLTAACSTIMSHGNYSEDDLEEQRMTAVRKEFEEGIEAPFIPVQWQW